MHLKYLKCFTWIWVKSMCVTLVSLCMVSIGNYVHWNYSSFIRKHGIILSIAFLMQPQWHLEKNANWSWMHKFDIEFKIYINFVQIHKFWGGGISNILLYFCIFSEIFTNSKFFKHLIVCSWLESRVESLLIFFFIAVRLFQQYHAW